MQQIEDNNNNRENIGLKPLVVKYLRRWRLFLTVFVLSFIPALLYLTLIPLTYEFSSAIQIQTEDGSGMGGLALGEAAGLMKSFGIGGSGGNINVEDEMNILSSNKLLSSVILELGTNVSYSRPLSLYRMYEDSPLKLTADSATMLNLDTEYRFAVSVSPQDIKVRVKTKAGRIEETFSVLPARIKVGDATFTLDFTNARSVDRPYRINIRCVPVSWEAEALAGTIKLEEVSKSSNVLLFIYTDHSKLRGKNILNTLFEKYNEDTRLYKNIQDRRTLTYIEGRIAETLEDLSRVELDIQAFKTENDMTLIEADVTMYFESMKELQSAIIETESQSRMIDMLDDYVKSPKNKYNNIPPLFTAAEGEKGGTIADYNAALFERDRILNQSNETNPLYKPANSKVEKMREAVYVMIDNSRKNYNATLATLKSKEKQILSKLKTIPAKEHDYVRYKRNQEILQGIYLLLLQKREETVLSLEQDRDKARVIEPAYAKKKTVNPRKLYAATGILALTLVLPIGIILSKELFLSLKEEYEK
jgi:uncharacterized protein involved in exopolysaccharide biosynthesis